MVIEAVTGQDYETACRREVFDPMGITADVDPTLRDRAPEGGWTISPIDYARFVQVFDHGNAMLSASTHASLEAQSRVLWLTDSRAPPMGGYGMGTWVQRVLGGLEFYHDGTVTDHLGGSISVKRASGWTAVFIFDCPTVGGEVWESRSRSRILRAMIDASLPG